MKRSRVKIKLRLLAFSLLLLLTNPYLANIAMKKWEGTPTPLKLVQPHDIGVVLTGVTNRYKKPRDRVYYNHGADRVLHTIQLYKMGKIDKILISGGSGKLIDNELDLKEANELAQTMFLAGIPEDAIFFENNSRNTHENAANCAQLLPELNVERVLLITSAFHMRRSYLCFTHENIAVTPFRTDFYASDAINGPGDVLFPNSSAIRNWEIIIREITGIMAYKLMGYA